MSASLSALILLNDLMFRVKVENSAKQAGFETRFAGSASDLHSQIQAQRPDLLIIDLNFQRASPLDVLDQLKGNEETKTIPVLGYVSHVQVDLKDEATKKGCDRVIARSALSDRLPEILAEFAGRKAF